MRVLHTGQNTRAKTLWPEHSGPNTLAQRTRRMPGPATTRTHALPFPLSYTDNPCHMEHKENIKAIRTMSGTVHSLKNTALPAREPAPAPFPLAVGRLHEIHVQGADHAAALAFALCSGAQRPHTAVWVHGANKARFRTQPGGHGLALLGWSPANLLVVDTDNEQDLMRAGLEAARCPGVDLVILETAGRCASYDLTASRRLALAAERARAGMIVLRRDSEPRPSAAYTRWAVTSAPSHALEAGAPGLPAIAAELLRWRGGAAEPHWRFAWDGDHGTFRDAHTHTPVSGALVPLFRMRDHADGSEPGQPRAA